jgi:hypothetical protein
MGGQGGADCRCGCPSLFAGGDFESDADVNGFDFDATTERTLVEEGGCGLMQLTSEATYPSRGEDVDGDVGGQCLVGRVRTRWTVPQGYVGMGIGNSNEGTAYELLRFTPTLGWMEHARECMLPETYVMTDAYMSLGINDRGAVLYFDYAEIFVRPCTETVIPCEP